MASYNKVLLMGNLTRDPQQSSMPSGTTVCEFSLAVNRRWRGQDGQSHEDVSFFDCQAYGRTGETISKYLVKGKPIFVEGQLRQSRWEDQSGQKRSKIRVIVDNFQFIDSRGGGDGGGGGEYGGGGGGYNRGGDQRGGDQRGGGNWQRGSDAPPQQQPQQQRPPQQQAPPPGDEDMPPAFEEDDIPF